jgi:hypothetical protein
LIGSPAFLTQQIEEIGVMESGVQFNILIKYSFWG